MSFPERVIAASNLHEHTGEVEIYCQDAAGKERGAQSRWSAQDCVPAALWEAAEQGTSDCWALHKEHRRALNGVNTPRKSHLKARLELDTVKSIITALKYKSEAAQIFKTKI